MEEFAGSGQNGGGETGAGEQYLSQRTLDGLNRKERDSKSFGDGVQPGENSEGAWTKQIEKVTSQIPSATFLSLAIASIGISAFFQLVGRKEDAQFVGQWVPTILTLGLYNKLVKIEGSE